MSRIGNNPITIPAGVEINLSGNSVEVKGPKGVLSLEADRRLKVEKVENQLLVKTSKKDKISRSLHGLTRSLINNLVVGVTDGWTKNLELVGVGYRASGGGNSLNLSVGFSHPVEVLAPEGITFTVADNTKLQVSGIDKILVGQIAANIRAIKPPEVYKGKGIRYQGEYIRRKAGKAGKAAGAK